MFTAGMHGSEHRKQEHRALRFSAPRMPFSPASGSTPPSTLQCLPVRGQQSVTTFRSPVTIPAFAGSIPGSTFPACYFIARLADSLVRSTSRLRRPIRFAPVADCLNASRPFPVLRPARLAAVLAPTPLRDSHIPPDRSVPLKPLQTDPPSGSARFPFAPRRSVYF
jgi:hypothetical protein